MRGSVPKHSVPHWCVVFLLPCECVTTIQKPSRRRMRLRLAHQLVDARATLFGR